MTDNSAISALGLISVRPDTVRKRVGGGAGLPVTPKQSQDWLERLAIWRMSVN